MIENEAYQPLPERMRPKTLNDFSGHDEAVGEGTFLRQSLELGKVFSMILWGPPGCGKTTLARLIANYTDAYFVYFSAVLSGVKEIRQVIDEAKAQRQFNQRQTILFVDEIHRFNKSQQDAFLHHVESGLIILIGATTENPSFEVIAPLLSRCRVIKLGGLKPDDLKRIVMHALTDTENGYGGKYDIADDALNFLADAADGDGRFALNCLEAIVNAVNKEILGVATDTKQFITLALAEKAVQKKAMLYDKNAEEHYNLISALHKSLRGSDPDAALYWLERMLISGDDPLYVGRRMVRFASEDIGNADPHALTVVLNAVQTYRMLGSPEGELALAQAALYLATAPKSNAVYKASNAVRKLIKETGYLPVPLHICNAPTKMMKDLGYGHDYKYAHDYKEGVVAQEHLPESLKGRRFYEPTDRGYEKTVKQRLEHWRQLLKK